MNKKILTSFVVAIAMLTSPLTFAHSKSKPVSTQLEDVGYVLGAGDTIKISVFKEDDLSLTVKLHKGGKVNFPYIGVITCAGRTPADVEKEIRAKLKDGFLRNPMVTVSIEKFRDIYVGGEVNKPGAYEFEPGMTVEKSIVLSGGITDRGDESDINLRVSATGELLESVDLSYQVQPGDVVLIEKSFF